MKSEIVKIDPKEFGLNSESVSTIEQAFMPKIIERDALIVIYDEITHKELTPESCMQAGDLHKKLVKIRTGIAEIHKTQKAFYLAAGRYVDAWKNKETMPIEQMETKLAEMETYFLRLEAERIEKLKIERVEKLKTVCDNTDIYNVELLNDESFQALYNGLKLAKEQKEAEEKRQEEIRKEAERKAEEERIKKEKAEAERQEAIRLENERLKKINEEKEKQLRFERLKAAELAEKERIANEAKLAEERRKNKIEQERIMAEKKKLEDQLIEKKKKEEAEKKRIEKEKKEKELQEKKIALAPDTDKLENFAKTIDLIINAEMPVFKTEESIKIYLNAQSLLSKVSNYIRISSQELTK